MHKVHVMIGTNDEQLVNVMNQWFKENTTIEVVNVTYKHFEGGTRVTAYVLYKEKPQGKVSW